MRLVHECMGCHRTTETDSNESALGWVRGQVYAYHPPMTEDGITGPMDYTFYACSIACIPAAVENSQVELPSHYTLKGQHGKRPKIIADRPGEESGGPWEGSFNHREMQANRITSPSEYHKKSRRGELQDPGHSNDPLKAPGMPVTQEQKREMGLL